MTAIWILPIWTKYLESPTLTTIGSTNFPIWQVGQISTFKSSAADRLKKMQHFKRLLFWQCNILSQKLNKNSVLSLKECFSHSNNDQAYGSVGGSAILPSTWRRHGKLVSPTLNDYYVAGKEKLSWAESGWIHSITEQYWLCKIEFIVKFHETW